MNLKVFFPQSLCSELIMPFIVTCLCHMVSVNLVITSQESFKFAVAEAYVNPVTGQSELYSQQWVRVPQHFSSVCCLS